MLTVECRSGRTMQDVSVGESRGYATAELRIVGSGQQPIRQALDL